MALTKQQVEEFDAKYGRIAHVKGMPLPGEDEPSWEVVLRKPRRAEYKVYRSQVTQSIADATEYYVLATCVHPTGDALEALLDEYPGIPEACGKQIHKLVGLEVEGAVK